MFPIKITILYVECHYSNPDVKLCKTNLEILLLTPYFNSPVGLIYASLVFKYLSTSSKASEEDKILNDTTSPSNFIVD